jgi:hypothetical protein
MDATADTQERLHFLYHELYRGQNASKYALRDDAFRAQCAFYAQWNSDVAEHLCPVLTFDDGHRSDFEIARPILQEHGLTALFFITAGWVGERDRYMRWEHLRALAEAGHTIGSHGYTHKLLTHCSDRELKYELLASRLKLEDRLGVAVRSISLPGGRHSPRVLEACWDAGYAWVYSSEPAASPCNPASGTVIGRANITSSMTAALLGKLLDRSSGRLHSLRRRHSWKESTKRILGDGLYAQLWSVVNLHGTADETSGVPR